jgi:hypothetical protein
MGYKHFLNGGQKRWTMTAYRAHKKNQAQSENASKKKKQTQSLRETLNVRSRVPNLF